MFYPFLLVVVVAVVVALVVQSIQAEIQTKALGEDLQGQKSRDAAS